MSAPVNARATVVKSGFGDREVRLSTYDPRAVGALRHCREGAVHSTWNPARGAWIVPASAWSCVRRLLVAEGYEIQVARS